MLSGHAYPRGYLLLVPLQFFDDRRHLDGFGAGAKDRENLRHAGLASEVPSADLPPSLVKAGSLALVGAHRNRLPANASEASFCAYPPESCGASNQQWPMG